MRRKRKQTYTKLRGICTEYEMTIEELGDQIGRSRSYMQQCLCGHADWRLSDIYRIMDLFGIPYERMHEYFPKNGRAA